MKTLDKLVFPVVPTYPMPTKPGINFQQMDIGPELAASMLENNPGNRSVQQRYVKQLSGAMKRGEWMLNGDVIRIADDGTLMDGQNRLLAIIDSGCTIRMIVATGIPRSTFATVDTGKPRSMPDVLHIRGEINANSLSALLRAIYHFETIGNPFERGHYAATFAQLEDVLARHPRARDSLAFVCNQNTLKKMTSPTVTAFCYYQFTAYAERINEPGLAEEFFDKLISGSGLSPTSPILILRDKLAEDRASSKRTFPYFTGVYFYKAFRAFEARAPMKLLRCGRDEVISFALD